MARHPKPDGRKRPSRESRLGRRTEHRAPRLRLLVVCGAEVTEYDYTSGGTSATGASRRSGPGARRGAKRTGSGLPHR